MEYHPYKGKRRPRRVAIILILAFALALVTIVAGVRARDVSERPRITPQSAHRIAATLPTPWDTTKAGKAQNGPLDVEGRGE